MPSSFPKMPRPDLGNPIAALAFSVVEQAKTSAAGKTARSVVHLWDCWTFFMRPSILVYFAHFRKQMKPN